MNDVTVFHTQSNGNRIRKFSIDGISVSVEAQESTHGEQAEALALALHAHANGKASDWARLRFERDTAVADADRARTALRAVEAALPPKTPARLLGDGCVRFDTNGHLWLLSQREKGWAAFGVKLDGWDDLFRRYNVMVHEQGADLFGCWWSVRNLDERTGRAGGAP